jgi:hypothetical protein
MTDSKTGRIVKLESSDKREFSVPVEVASMSVTIKNMLEGMFYFCLLVFVTLVGGFLFQGKRVSKHGCLFLFFF